jgi:hypothetical protein
MSLKNRFQFKNAGKQIDKLENFFLRLDFIKINLLLNYFTDANQTNFLSKNKVCF